MQLDFERMLFQGQQTKLYSQRNMMMQMYALGENQPYGRVQVMIVEEVITKQDWAFSRPRGRPPVFARPSIGCLEG